MRYKRLQSTNTTAYRLAEKGAEDWTIVVSKVQTRGRGRRGRGWKSPKGGLWFSIVLRPHIHAGEVQLLQFFAANALRQGIEKATGIKAKVKWPNDLLLNSQKLGGILVEAKLVSNQVLFVIIGIGINVNLDIRRLPQGASSLSQNSGKHYDLEAVLESLLRSLSSEYERPWNPAQILSEWWDSCIHREKSVKIETPNGTIKGLNTGIEPSGRLIVETDKGEKHIVDEGTLRLLDD